MAYIKAVISRLQSIENAPKLGGPKSASCDEIISKVK